MHNLTKTLAAMSLLAPLTAHSLGVGDIKLHSALNQKLNAEIALSLAADEDLADIKVTLAPPDKFDKLGISWSHFLSKVKFQPVLKANGKVVVKMTSDETVQEPFLDFLVEVSWPKGDVFKEFTVLVDPPVTYQQGRIDTPIISSSKPAHNATSVSKKSQNNFAGLAVNGEYGPTIRNDTLWKVAERVNKHSDISVEQMMMALYKANPKAFYKKNVNALMAGKSLKIPKKADIVQISKKQANTQFYRQMAVWEGKAVSQPDEQLATTTESSSQLTLVPPAEEVVTNSDALTANATDTDSLSTENQQLQERLANLEKQFAIMQEMMAIKDQQLAVMQNAQAMNDLQADPVSVQDMQAVIDDPEEITTDQEESSEQGVSSPGLESVKVEPVKEVSTQAQTEVVSEKQTIIKPNAPVKAAVHKVKKQPVVKHDTGVNYYYLGLGIFGALTIGGIGWLFWRRRQTEEEINENSMFASSSEIFLPDSDTDDELDMPIFEEKSSYDVGTVGESSFLSEFTPSDFDVFETDQAEVDPTSETDVYLAYGRYQQAEELMRQAIIDHPDKDDYKLKLLEIFYTSENAESYEKFSNELVAEGKNTDLNFWAKVAEMGSELIPGAALFSAAQTESKFEIADELSEENDDATVVAQVPSEPAQETSDPAQATADHLEASSDIDFDLSSFSLDESEDTSSVDAMTDIESVEFDLNSFESGSDDSGKDKEIETVELTSNETDDFNLDDFEFSTDDAGLTESQDELSISEVAKEPNTNNFDFDDISAPVADISNDSAIQDENDIMVSDLTDMDEFETKIDLAKAYIDMGDEFSAKEIAQEVFAKGNTTQKNEAQAIIGRLS